MSKDISEIFTQSWACCLNASNYLKVKCFIKSNCCFVFSSKSGGGVKQKKQSKSNLNAIYILSPNQQSLYHFYFQNRTGRGQESKGELSWESNNSLHVRRAALGSESIKHPQSLYVAEDVMMRSTSDLNFAIEINFCAFDNSDIHRVPRQTYTQSNFSNPWRCP